MDETLYTRWMPQLTREQIKAFALYQDMLQDWNSRMNLTAITQPEEVASKHFADSVLPAALLPPGAKVIDVGTGAGFPGLPLRILRPDIQLTLLDSLQKRIGFLTALCQALGFADVALLHARAEDAGRDPALRGRFHIALSRAVAPFPVLLEGLGPQLEGEIARLLKEWIGKGDFLLTEPVRPMPANASLKSLEELPVSHKF